MPTPVGPWRPRADASTVPQPSTSERRPARTRRRPQPPEEKGGWDTPHRPPAGLRPCTPLGTPSSRARPLHTLPHHHREGRTPVGPWRPRADASAVPQPSTSERRPARTRRRPPTPEEKGGWGTPPTAPRRGSAPAPRSEATASTSSTLSHAPGFGLGVTQPSLAPRPGSALRQRSGRAPAPRSEATVSTSSTLSHAPGFSLGCHAHFPRNPRDRPAPRLA
jgi:hypothetical protein